MKTLNIFFLFLFIVVNYAAAQPAKTNSAAEKSAEKDAGQFKLEHSLWKQFRQNHFSPASDYFKPGEADVIDINNLNDSVYVKAFRNYAYQKTVHRHTAGHYFLIFGSIGVALAGLILILIASQPD